ncbi:MAG: hypothetical protein V3U96_02550 [Paracoccaceae bacterium]
MTAIKTTLLFVGEPALTIENFVESLKQRLTAVGMTAEEISPLENTIISFRAAGATVTVSSNQTALSADTFENALESQLSKPALGMLSETLVRHTRHMVVSVDPNEDAPQTSTQLLQHLQLAHATTCLLAEWHTPGAVHWTHSNQLLTGGQYLKLMGEPNPWVLFCSARLTYSGQPDQMVRARGVILPEAAQFIGRPIRLVDPNLPLDQSHAAALAFLRHAVETGATLPDGDRFGPKKGSLFSVSHLAENDDFPNGLYDLSVVTSDADTAVGGPARPPTVVVKRRAHLPAAQPLTGIAAPHPRERTRSMAIAYLMLVILPPVGAILLMSNAIFGSSVFRTGVVALASVAVAVIVSAFAFVNDGQDSALLFQTETIKSSILGE